MFCKIRPGEIANWTTGIREFAIRRSDWFQGPPPRNTLQNLGELESRLLEGPDEPHWIMPLSTDHVPTLREPLNVTEPLFKLKYVTIFLQKVEHFQICFILYPILPRTCHGPWSRRKVFFSVYETKLRPCHSKAYESMNIYDFGEGMSFDGKQNLRWAAALEFTS